MLKSCQWAHYMPVKHNYMFGNQKSATHFALRLGPPQTVYIYWKDNIYDFNKYIFKFKSENCYMD